MMTYANASYCCQRSLTVDDAAGCGRQDNYWRALAVHLNLLRAER